MQNSSKGAVSRSLWVWSFLAALGTGLPKLDYTSDYRVYFGEDNPERAACEQFEKTCVQTDNILIVV